MKTKYLYGIIVILGGYLVYLTIYLHQMQLKAVNIYTKYEKNINSLEIKNIEMQNLISNLYSLDNILLARKITLTSNHEDNININELIKDRTYFLYIPEYACQACVKDIYNKIEKQSIRYYILCNVSSLRRIKNLLGEQAQSHIFAIINYTELNSLFIKNKNICIFTLNNDLFMQKYTPISGDFLDLFDLYIKEL